MKKLLLGVLSIACLSCVVAAIPYETANADEVVGNAELFTATKCQISENGKKMLMVTGITDVSMIYKMGYEVNGKDYVGGEGETTEMNVYYESLTLGTKTKTASQFIEGAEALLIWEIAYDNTVAYDVQPYAYVGVIGEDGSFERPEVEEKTYGVMKDSFNVFTVTWKNDDGTVIETDDNAIYGSMPTYNSENPKKDFDAENNYTFAGWDKEIEEVTGTATYTATYKSEARVFFKEIGNAVYSTAMATKVEIQNKVADADQDGKYHEVLASGLTGVGNNLLILSGTGDYPDWCPKGLFGFNGYNNFANKKLGMYVKVSTAMTFTLGGVQGNLTTIHKVEESAQTVTPEDGWRYIEFDLSKLTSGRYFTAIMTDIKDCTVLVDGVKVFTDNYNEEGATYYYDLSAAKRSTRLPVAIDNGVVVADYNGDNVLWNVQASGLSGLGNHFMVLSGTADFDWCPAGLFNTNKYSSYQSQKLGMYVKVDTAITFTLGGMKGNWSIVSAEESAQTVTPEDGWTYIEFDLSKMPSGGAYIAGILTDATGDVWVDGVKTFTGSYTDANATIWNNLARAKTSGRATIQVNPLEADKDGDNEYWTAYGVDLSCIGKHLLVLGGNGESWSPKGLFGGTGSSVYKNYADKYIGMWVKVSQDTTFSLGGGSGAYVSGGHTGSQMVTAEDGWTYIEFKLSELSSSYRYMPGIMVDVIDSAVCIDGIEIYSESRL